MHRHSTQHTTHACTCEYAHSHTHTHTPRMLTVRPRHALLQAQSVLVPIGDVRDREACLRVVAMDVCGYEGHAGHCPISPALKQRQNVLDNVRAEGHSMLASNLLFFPCPKPKASTASVLSLLTQHPQPSTNRLTCER